ncbi:ROK family protein [Streptomyces sp. B21-083]|uniref:ROK family protein n=1 Tax=Streptomyces sp. B21-083 TaxID=3039410 RepID=UPI002FF0E449
MKSCSWWYGSNAFPRGEAVRGALAGPPHVLAMTQGTGVGGALWLDGALYGGPHGAAGEIGRIPGFGDLTCTWRPGTPGGARLGARRRPTVRRTHRTRATATRPPSTRRRGCPRPRDPGHVGLRDVTVYVVGGGCRPRMASARTGRPYGTRRRADRQRTPRQPRTGRTRQ